MFLSEKPSSTNLFRKLFGIALILPALVFIGLTMLLPLFWNIILSFQNWDGMSQIKWAQFNNYINAFNDGIVLASFGHSIFIAFVAASLAVFLGLALALMIYKMGKIEGAFFRLIFYTPTMLPLTIVALLFTFIYNPDIGLLNGFLKLCGLESLGHAWLSEPGTVLCCIAFAAGWRLAGLNMMLCFTAITSVPISLYEAAKIDGANYLKQIAMIILPMIKQTIVLSGILTLVITFKTYDIVWVMTKGGPADLSKTVPIQMVEVAFRYNQFGYAAAIGTLFIILVMTIMFVVKKMTRGEVYEY